MEKPEISFIEIMKRSFGFAFEGVAMLTQERNFRIHLIVGTLAIILGFVLDLELTEWCIIVLAIGTVLAAEAFNSAIEEVCNSITGDIDPRIKKVKDISAAAVLFTAIAAAVIGGVIFLSKVM